MTLRPTPNRRSRYARHPRALLPGVIVAYGCLLLLVVTVAVAAYSPTVAARLPLVGSFLNAVAPALPASVAWLHDRGTPRLLPGVYFGWSDGVRGELHLYGEGCSAGQGTGAGDVVELTLTGRDGVVVVPPDAVAQLWTELDRARAHPHLRLEVVTERTMEFDRAHLRCRDGTEASARLLATVHHVEPSELAWPPAAAPLAVDPVLTASVTLPPEAEARAIIDGPSSLPGAGKIAELTLAAGSETLTALAILYAPRRAASGEVLAAAGQAATLPYWRNAAAAQGAPWVSRPALPALTAWHAAYQAPNDPRALGVRPSADLGLPLAAGEFGALFLYPSAFRTTPTPRPVLLKPLLELDQGGHRATVVTSGLAFGWTATP